MIWLQQYAQNWYNFPVPTQKSHFSVTLLLSELSVSLYH